MMPRLDTLLRKKRSLVKVVGFVVATVTIISVAMVTQLQHATDMGHISMDYDFDLNRGYHDYNPLSNDDDHLSNKLNGENNNIQLLNLQRRDTLAVKNDYRYLSKRNTGNDWDNSHNKKKLSETPLRKINSSNSLSFEIQRNQEFIDKQNKLRKLRSENRDKLEDIIEDEEDSDYEYEYENNNPIFKPGDFDLPDNFYESKVKFNGKIKTEKNKVGYNEDDSDYDTYDDEIYDSDEDDDADDDADENKAHENILLSKDRIGVGGKLTDSETKESFLIPNGELADTNNVLNLLHSLPGAVRENMIPDPCRGAVDCGVNNESHRERSNAKMQANMASNHRANLASFRMHKHFQLPQENKPNGVRNMQHEQKLLSHANSVDNAEYQNHIETQIPVHDGVEAVAMEYPGTQVQPNTLSRHQDDVHNTYGMPIVVNKIYWSKEALEFVPKGITDEEFQDYLSRVSQYPVTVMRDPKWNQCGRLKNQYLQLSDGTAMCARYRLPHMDLVHGELLSFYLSRFLGMDNVPPVVLAKVDTNATLWNRVKSRVHAANWQQNSLVALILWIDNIESREYMPSVILNAFENNSTFTVNNSQISSMTSSELADVIQWSDLILFDYLTGNYDRVASMQDGAERESKSSIMRESIRNLRADKNSGRLWFIDNESGLLDAYELMYHVYRHEASRFLRFHKQMLHTVCIFNRQTVRKIRQMAQHSAPHELLVKYALQQDPLYKQLPWTKSVELFYKRFHTRLKEVTQWFDYCEMR